MNNLIKQPVVLTIIIAFIITGCSDDGGGSKKTIPVTGVSLKESTSIHINSTEQLTAEISPADAANRNVTWSSSDESIASVSTAGLLTGLSEGNAIITVTTVDGNFQDTCNVTVITIEKIIIADIAANDNTIDLGWINLDDDYLDYVEISYTDGTSTDTVNVDSGVQTHKISGLDAVTAYTIKIRAVDTIGNISAPNIFTVSTTSGGSITFCKIYVADDLNAVRSGLDKHYILRSHIDLSGYSTGEGWVPIGDDANQFIGSLIGNGYVVYNLTIDRDLLNTDYQGLFGYIGSGARIENVGLENCNIQGDYCQYTGGLAGVNEGEINNCYINGSVEGYEGIGGLLGINDGGGIFNCYAMGAIAGNTDIGGLLGNNAGGIIINCYATGAVTGDTNVGGLAGFNFGGTVEHCFYYQSPNNGIGTFSTESAMKTGSTYIGAGWDFAGETANGSDDIWSIDGDINYGFPYLRIQSPATRSAVDYK